MFCEVQLNYVCGKTIHPSKLLPTILVFPSYVTVTLTDFEYYLNTGVLINVALVFLSQWLRKGRRKVTDGENESSLLHKA